MTWWTEQHTFPHRNESMTMRNRDTGSLPCDCGPNFYQVKVSAFQFTSDNPRRGNILPLVGLSTCACQQSLTSLTPRQARFIAAALIEAATVVEDAHDAAVDDVIDHIQNGL